MFHRLPAFLGAALLLLVIGQGPATADEFIRVATFNIANFGDRDEYSRSLIALTNIVLKTEADLVAIQEVEPNQLGRDQVERLVDLLNVASAHYATQPYTHAISPEHIGDETTAFVWRDPVELLGEIELLSHDADPDGDGLRTFQRVPSIAPFRAGNYDFLVVNCHLYTKVEGVSSEGRGAELEALATWLRSLPSEAEKDAIVLGDFNRFLNDSSGTTWATFMPSDHEEHYRFPLLEAIERDRPSFDPREDEAPEDTYSTTTAKKRSIYDQVVIAKGSYREFVDDPVFGVDIGIVAFDDDPQYEWFIDKWHQASSMLSDHRPVWIRLRIDQADDD